MSVCQPQHLLAQKVKVFVCFNCLAANWGIVTLVHGDDFVSTGNRRNIAKFRKALEERFKIKPQVLGSGAGELREARALNRIIRVTDEG